MIILQLILKYLKKFVIAAFVIYAYNMIAVNFNLIIPINIWTILFVGLFDIPGIITLIIIKIWGIGI